MPDPELLERITARRAELDELEEQLAKQLTHFGGDWDLAQDAVEKAATSPA
ncbi:hypothetical protein [Streptomyces soliscabiei]|uniref:hypothetical protein n=1 Tax=Streptomyces soliscabiei TaxID=588897 RepID=UPI0029A27672|nr:hypothetical protein [Streptomyces sp. NY05-11A]MDX2680670.1 hypothetical protein [Streptomyces sp. NY05-11A]